MNPCLLTLALTLGCAPAPATDPGPAAPADRWVAEDKLRHFAISFAATHMMYGGARFVTDSRTAVPAAASAALALGLGKEIADVRRGRPFSLKDLAWDAAGVALGVLLVRQIR